MGFPIRLFALEQDNTTQNTQNSQNSNIFKGEYGQGEGTCDGCMYSGSVYAMAIDPDNKDVVVIDAERKIKRWYQQ